MRQNRNFIEIEDYYEIYIVERKRLSLGALKGL